MKIDLTPLELFAVYDALGKVRPTLITQIASEKIKDVMLSNMEDKSEKYPKWDMVSLEQWEKAQLDKMRENSELSNLGYERVDTRSELCMDDPTFVRTAIPTVKLPRRSFGSLKNVRK